MKRIKRSCGRKRGGLRTTRIDAAYWEQADRDRFAAPFAALITATGGRAATPDESRRWARMRGGIPNELGTRRNADSQPKSDGVGADIKEPVGELRRLPANPDGGPIVQVWPEKALRA